MSKMDSKLQKVFMSWMYRGKEIFKPLNTGWIDEHVACVREWVANIFFYTKNGTTLMIDAGYNYDRLGEKMGWLGIDPSAVRHILITHQDTDHVGAVETDSDGLFKQAALYLSEIENRYLTGEVRRKVLFGKTKLSIVHTDNPRGLLREAAGGSGGYRRADRAAVPEPVGRRDHLSGLFRRHDEKRPAARRGHGREKRLLRAGRRGRTALCRREL